MISDCKSAECVTGISCSMSNASRSRCFDAASWSASALVTTSSNNQLLRILRPPKDTNEQSALWLSPAFFEDADKTAMHKDLCSRVTEHVMALINVSTTVSDCRQPFVVQSFIW